MYERRVNTVSQYQLAQYSAHSLLSIPLVNNPCGGRLKNSKNPRPDLHSNQVTPPLSTLKHTHSRTLSIITKLHTQKPRTPDVHKHFLSPRYLSIFLSPTNTHTRWPSLSDSTRWVDISGSRRHCTACLSFSRCLCFFISHFWSRLCSI